MKIINVYCDACGDLTTEYHVIEDLDNGDDMQFCPKCWPTILRTVRHLAAGMMAAVPDDPAAGLHPEDRFDSEIPEEDGKEDLEEAVVEAAEEIPEKDQTEETPEEPRKRKPDKGKAQALRDAGWSVSAIAEEIGVSDWWVYKNTENRNKRERKALEWE